ncbi:MAG: hypothetical protein KME20_25045 [Kaiparowitsia implicata GSE-PSE-MK54-09C]|jgi:hypothetical protein|nr:hypothetical protein [Kaiparowitsia implicata GSE-PSE-MK54-09C]
MKSNQHTSHPITSNLDVWAGIAWIAAAAIFVSSLPILFSSELAYSPANNDALLGEAGLWGEFGRND